jgi:hypothetical protein
MRHAMLILLTLFLVAGCQRHQPKSNPSKAKSNPEQPKSKANPVQEAIAYIEKLGGQVGKKYIWGPANTGKISTKTYKQLRSSLPRQVPDIVVWVKLARTNVDDAGLERLRVFTQLRTLNLDGTKVSDEGLAHLKGLPLQALHLNGTKVSDEGLADLDGLPLQVLNLNDTQITDAGLAHLSDSRDLSSLYLANTLITDEGLAHLKNLTRLSILDLRGTKILDPGLAHLQQFPEFEEKPSNTGQT